jgi:O-antigen/teichoic acid export membrane protein
MSGRVHKSILNAEVNLLFYFLSLFLAFFSRKIFLDCLGADFIGLTATLGNILGYLNLAELGISSCISFFLFKPLQTDNHETINEIMSVFGYLYRCIGLIIFGGGIFVSLFFPIIFGDENIGMGIVYFAFYSFMGSSLIGYFINYRQILLSADQKNYVVTSYMQSAAILKTALQIFLAYNYSNLYVWVAVEFIFGILACIVLNWKINQTYPWLKTDKRSGRQYLKKYPDILNKTRQIFIHKLKQFITEKSDELFVFVFVSLKMVAYYGNYTMIIAKISLLFSAVLDSFGAGIGNLIAEGNKQHIMNVFWELNTIMHFVAGIMFFCIYHFLEPFISVWLGPEYVLGRDILLLLCILRYFNASRVIVEVYNHAHGLFADIWAAWTELAINVIITLFAGYMWGIAGILLGKVISVGLLVILWKPYYLFTSGLHESYRSYWYGVCRNFVVSAVSFVAAHMLLSLIPLDATDGYLSWTLYCMIGMTFYLSINLTLIMLFCKGAKDSINRVKSVVFKKRHRK